MGLQIRVKCDPMVLKSFFFQKITKNLPAAGAFAPKTPIASGGWGFRPLTPVNNAFELQYTSLLYTSPNLDIFTF